VAVYERTYRGYEGPLTPVRQRFRVLPRYALSEVFRSRMFIAFFVLCFVWPLGLAIYIYIPHNLKIIETFGLEGSTLASLFVIDASFFLDRFMWLQGVFAVLMTIFVAPALVAPDLRNNGLALYFSRPLTRTDYVIGKGAVLVFLLSCITWLPGLVLFLLQSYLAGWSWFRDNVRVGAAILVGSVVWMVALTLFGLAASAALKWKPLAGAGLFGLFFVTPMLAAIVNAMFETEWGAIVDPRAMVTLVWSGLFGVADDRTLPVLAGWCSLALACGACWLLLGRRLRAYEVVR
jgi:ABC-2 type transport system permease protein